MKKLKSNQVIWHDDSLMASPEEDAKYPLTKEQEQRLNERLEKVFSDFGLNDDLPIKLPAAFSDAAKYILEKQGTMSTWALQKLCYYAQAWHATWTGNRLIKEDFQAWSKGPVCVELYNRHKGKRIVSAKDFSFADSSKLSADEKDSIDIVLEHYGGLSSDELVKLTHSEEPWIKARNGLPDDAKSNAIISLESMREYYRKHLI